MGLTRIQAFQISDIDYKQAVRVIATSNITLSGGAPASVDGITLVVGDRVLVAGQNTGSQNGLYKVATLGTGSNGTWVRTLDGDTTGEIEAGMIVMVTEGDVYKDTQWKLTTDNPIVIGVTPLTFEQNSAFAFGNIYANSTAVLATTVGDTLTLTAGNNISIIGDASTKSVSIGVTGISLSSIANGTSNVNVVSSGGNVTVGVGGTGNVAIFSTSGANITGYVTASGNVTGTYILGNGSQLTGINTFSTIAVSGQSNVVADSIADTLTLTAGTGIAITTSAGNDTITISSAATDSIFATGGDMGTVTEIVTSSEDLGTITSAVTVEYNLGTITTGGIVTPSLLLLPSYTVAGLSSLSADPAGQFVFCSNESGGSVPAFSDGTNWRRVTDRAIVS
jgi:hypothetical protein